MKQSRIMSLVESVTNVAVGFGIACTAQAWLFRAYGLHITTGQNLTIGGVLTIVSVLRSFTLRRIFEIFRMRQIQRTRP